MLTLGSRILVVDDEPTNRDILERRLAKLGYLVFTAADGRQCLDYLADQEYDLVLLDIMMPVLDGMATLREIRSRFAAGRLPVIMTTARDGTEDIVDALRAGANDYVTKPIDFPVLQARLDTHLRLKQTTADLELAYQRIKREIDTAARIQRAQIPASALVHHGLRCCCRYLPCEELAGDILDYYVLSPDQVALYLLDVSGHGAGAALLSSGLSRLLAAGSWGYSVVGGSGSTAGQARRRSDDHPAPPKEVLARLNRRFPMDYENSQFFTILYAIVEPQRGVLRYASAGHPGPLIIRRDGGNVERAGSTGLPVGVIQETSFAEKELHINRGDKVLFFSDGVVEASDRQRRLFGYERLIGLLAGAGDQDMENIMDQVIREVQDWSDGSPQDDITLLGLEYE